MTAPLLGPVATDATLHLVADSLLDQLVAGELEPSLIRLTDPEQGGLDLGTRPLEGVHPSSWLLGFNAPRHWHALGTATSGWAYHPDQRADVNRTRWRCHTVLLVSRTGETASRLVVHGRPELDRDLADSPLEGEQSDLLRRALGLPTEPPPTGTEALFAVDWLCGLLETQLRQLRRLDEVTRLHPARQMLEGHDVDLDDLPADPVRALVALARSHSRVVSWPVVRQLTASSRWEAPDLAPSDAEWLDDGAFARWILSRVPPLAMLRSQVAGHLRPNLVPGVNRVLDRLGLSGGLWPDTDAA